MEPVFLPEPTILIPNPKSQPVIKDTENTLHSRHSEFAIVVDPPSYPHVQHFCYLANVQVYHSMDPEFKTYLTDPLLTFLANSRGEPKFEPFSGTDNPGFKSVPQKIK